MSEEKERNGFIAKLSPGNLITIFVIVGGIISTWAGINSHINDEIIHINKDDKFLLKIEQLDESIHLMKMHQAVHDEQYNTLLQEHNDLEDKVSRVHKELKNEIKEIK